MHTPLTYSQRRARLLLAAWNSADLSRLEAALCSACSSPAPTFEEEERLEMVAEVESSLRDWLDRTGSRVLFARNEVALFTALKVLRHLAGCEAAASVYQAQWSGSLALESALR